MDQGSERFFMYKLLAAPPKYAYHRFKVLERKSVVSGINGEVDVLTTVENDSTLGFMDKTAA